MNSICVLDPVGQVIGPADGTGTDDVNLSGGDTPYALGSAVKGSSLTSVGTLTALAVNGSNATFTNSGSCEVTLISNASNDSGVYFNNGSANNGAVIYDHPNDALKFRINGNKTIQANSDGDLLPGADNDQDLGSTTKRWANVYSADVHLNNTGTGGNEIDGSEGHWTMQEGADDLFLINRITGKKYKFNLTEV